MALGMGTDFRFDIFARDRTGPAWRGVENSVQRAQRSVQSFMRAAGPLLGLGGAVSAGALAFATREALEYADALVQAADRTSFAVEELEALRYAGRLNRVQFQQTDMAVQRFSRRVAEAANGTGELEGDLSALGIRLRDSEGRMRSSYEILLDYADAVAGAESEQEQLRLAFKAFDSEGAALVNVLRQGRSGLEGYAEQAREAGAIMGDELARNAAEAATAFERMRVNFEADRNRAVAEHADNLELLAEQLSSIATLGIQAASALGAMFNTLAAGNARSGDAAVQALDAEILARQLQEGEFRGGPGQATLGFRMEAALGRDEAQRIISGVVDSAVDNIRVAVSGYNERQRQQLVNELREAAIELRAFGEVRPDLTYDRATGRFLDDNFQEVVPSPVPRLRPARPSDGNGSGDNDDNATPPDPTSSITPRLSPRVIEEMAAAEGAIKVEAARKAAAEIAGIQAEEYEQEMQELGERFERQIQWGLEGAFRAAADGDLLSFFARNLQTAIFESASQGLASAFAEDFVGSSFGSFLSGILGGSFGGGKAAGGPVQPGKFYAWQEQGQEFFAPNVPGQVLRADSIGGSAPVIVNQFHLHAEGAVMTDQLMMEMDSKAEAAARGAVAISRSDMARARSRSSKRLR